jgi:hypothetical protein
MTGAPDLFTPLACDAVDLDVMLGFDTLMRPAPLWPMDRGIFWADVVARARAFAVRWVGPCRAYGWAKLELYGVDRNTPGARLSNFGVAWLVAGSAYHVLEASPNVITVTTRSASRLSIYKLPPDPDAVLAWEL